MPLRLERKGFVTITAFHFDIVIFTLNLISNDTHNETSFSTIAYRYPFL
jgi:hypothetical protein